MEVGWEERELFKGCVYTVKSTDGFVSSHGTNGPPGMFLEEDVERGDSVVGSPFTEAGGWLGGESLENVRNGLYSKLKYKVKSKAVIDGLNLLELRFKEIQNSLSFVGFGEITLDGVERGTVRGMVEGRVWQEDERK